MNDEDRPPPAAPGAPMLDWWPAFRRVGSRLIRGHTRLLGLAILVGVFAGVGAVFFYGATQAVSHFALEHLAGYRPATTPAGETSIPWLDLGTGTFRPWLLLIIPAVGGLLSGILVFTVAPEAEGHGTDAVIASYHQNRGYIRPRTPLVKIIASALTIGSGGSGGREGPIAQIGAGFGSFLAGLFRLQAAERRVLAASGMGAGIAAIFHAPLAGALFASEVLYWSPEFEAEVILPAALASVVSYCTFGAVFGWNPLFATPDLTFTAPLQLAPYTLLAFMMAALAAVYTRTFYALHKVFRAWRFPRHLKPAVGALLTGALGLILYLCFGKQVLAVLSFGYGALQGGISLEWSISGWILIAIALGKIVTTSLTIGSGGSGGVFGPSMVIGGCGGGALGVLFHQLWPTLVPHPAAFIIVGMAGFFAAAAKTPISTLVIVSEMTGGYQLLLPALWVCALCFLLSDSRSIYSAQLEGQSRSPAHRGRFVARALAGIRVQQFLGEPRTNAVRADDSLATVIDRLGHGAYPVLPVVDDAGVLVGVVNLEDVYIASQPPGLASLIVAHDLMRPDVVPLHADDDLPRAQELFTRNDLPALPVVDRTRHVVGMVRRNDVASTYLRHLHGDPPSLP